MATAIVLISVVTIAVLAVQVRTESALLAGAREEANTCVALVRTARTWTFEHNVDASSSSQERAAAMRDADRMVREMADDARGRGGVEFHLTAAHPLNDVNAPDSWESAGLQALANGQSQYEEVTGARPSRTLRLLHPLVGGTSCLRCHEASGVGSRQIIGAVSVTVPLKNQDALLRRSALWLTALWVVVTVGLTAMTIFLVYRLVSRLEAGEERLREMAMTDPLTGIYNRRAVFELLTTEIERTRRKKAHLGVVAVDLDHFKVVNDTYGHAAGDEVLKEAVRRMQSSIRSYDVIGRVGGEEFIVVAPDIEADELAMLAERMRRSVSETPIPINVTTQVAVTASLGYALFREGGDADTLTRRADSAVYAAKAAGRNATAEG
jgi:diguanylate cyclase (GGDEF)-like protein